MWGSTADAGVKGLLNDIKDSKFIFPSLKCYRITLSVSGILAGVTDDQPALDGGSQVNIYLTLGDFVLSRELSFMAKCSWLIS